ncbi:MAG TPA: hypothetical protein VHZ95_11500 [Polyangiales bacterium]|nr:hypothetical protein [Polyangiales bacterium]
MSAAIAQRGPYAAIADAVGAHLEGERLAKAVLSEIDRGIALPDSLEHGLRAVEAGWSRPGTAGFCRAIQKRLEREA